MMGFTEVDGVDAVSRGLRPEDSIQLIGLTAIIDFMLWLTVQQREQKKSKIRDVLIFFIDLTQISSD